MYLSAGCGGSGDLVERTMERWRKEGKGPRFVKVGRRVAYHGADLIAFREQHKRTHTAHSRS